MRQKKYLVLMADYPPRDEKAFYDALYTALPGEVVAQLHLSEDQSEERMKEAVGEQADIWPVLVYYNSGYIEDMRVSTSELVWAAAHSSLITKHPAQTVEYSYTIQGRGYGTISYHFEV